MIGKILLVLGILGVVLGSGLTLVSMALPALTDGRTSWGEAAMGIIPGILVLVVSIIMVLIALILIANKRKQANR